MTHSRSQITRRGPAFILAVALCGSLVCAQQEPPPVPAPAPDQGAAPPAVPVPSPAVTPPAGAEPAPAPGPAVTPPSGEETPAAPGPTPAFPARPGAGLAGGAVPGSAMGGLGLKGPLRLKFLNAPTDMLLDAYAEQTGRTLLLAPTVPKANVTLRSQGELTKDEYLNAIETVLGMNGVALIREGEKFLRVVLNTAARTEPMAVRGLEAAESTALPGTGSKESEKPLKDSGELVSQMIQLRNIQPADAQKAVDALKHPYGQVHVFENVNSLLVTDTSANVNRILQMLSYIDKPQETREVPLIYDIRFAKASEIKAKLEEIIAESQKEVKKSTIPQARQTGAPGFVTPSVPAVPGVIRAIRPTPLPGAISEAVEMAERGIISGTVRMIADDRTGKLIIISWPENKVFFDMVIKVLDIETAPDVVVRVFRLEFAKSKDIASILNELIGAAAKGDTKSATPGAPPAAAGGAESAALKEYLARQQAAAVAATEAAGAATGATKTKIGQLSKENIKILSDERTNSLIIMASKNDMAMLDEIIKGMDLMLYQVLIEALIVGISLQDSVDTGVTWFQQAMATYQNNVARGTKPLFTFAGGGGGGSGVPNPVDATAAAFTGGGLTYYFTYFDIPLDVVLKAISTDSRTRILESPVIHTTDNKEAKIDVSTEAYFYKGQTPTSVGGSIAYVPNVETRKVGINLTVTPHINQKKYVLMDVSQKIENQSGTQEIAGQGTWPVIASREMSASIGVRSGETIVLGGLSTRDNSDSRTKIPLLGDIPILGRLFNSTGSTKKREEILVFITPYVLDPSADMGIETRRLKDALGPDGKWQRGWSGSKLGEPNRAEAREMRTQEAAARAAKDAAKKEVDAALMQEMNSAEKQWSGVLENVDRDIERKSQP